MGTGESSAAQSSELGPPSTEHVSCALHEVSNALTVVLGWLEMANAAPTHEEARRAIAVALEHARRGRVIARRGIGAEVESVQERRFASDLAVFAGRSIEPQARAREIQIEVRAAAESAQRIDGDSDALQVLTNLLLNALQFSPDGGKITLSAGRGDGGIVLEVTDQGPGVPLGLVNKIFDGGTTTRAEGAGIGLPFSRRLARRNGGDLRLINPGEPGARFELSWPCALSSQVPPPRGASEELKGARILMIEDDHSIAHLVELSLEARGAHVLPIIEPESLDEVLSSRPIFDLGLIDLSPIKTRALEILARLRHLAPDAPLIMMSGEPGALGDEIEERFAEAVRKPFDMDQLAEAAARCLVRARQGRPEQG